MPHPTLQFTVSSGVSAFVLSGTVLEHYVIETATQLGPNADWAFGQNVLLLESPQAITGFEISATEPRFFRARFIP